MRTALVVVGLMLAVALLLPVTETKAVPLGGLQLVGEQRTSTPDLVAAGKNGNTGKNGNSGKNGRGGGSTGSAGQAAGAIGGFGSFLGARQGGMGGPDLVPVALR